MPFQLKSALVAATVFLSGFSTAHPGEDHTHEIEERAAWLNQVERRDLAHCQEKLEARGVHARSILRRRALAEKRRAKRALQERDLATAIATSHKSNLTGITLDTPVDQLFSGNSQCILNPETTEGPYYVEGELVRQDMTDEEPGVPLTLDIQVIDVSTCEPVTDIYLEAWHCNSTGVYSGVVANGNGNSNDASNIDATFLRGIQKATSDGVVTFDTVFPGHYTGRTTHIHVLGHMNATLAANNTLASQGSINHVGQMFFDQDLISEVELTSPYSTNTQDLTTNADDNIASQAAEDVDPFMTYVLLGDSVSDGILAWTTIGVNVTMSKDVSAAAHIYADGGVANANSGMGGGGMGGGPPDGTGLPSGGVSVSASGTGSAAAAATTLSTSASRKACSAGLSWYAGVYMATAGFLGLLM